MKRFIIALTALLAMTATADAMSYEQAREQALFLTDKMAYELNLTEDQYEAAYEVNLDYLMSINSYEDLYGVYWRNRNLDLSYILLDWQYNAFCAASYFYRPLYWNAGAWHFGIYARYPHRHYFYFGRPHFYATYRGGHSWRMNGGRSWYHGRTYGHHHRTATNNHGFGMRNGFDRGDFRGRSGNFRNNTTNRDGNHGRNNRNNDNRNNKGYHHNDNNRRGFGGSNRPGNSGENRGRSGFSNRNGSRGYNRNGAEVNRESSTRQTVTNRINDSGVSPSSSYRGNRSTGQRGTSVPVRTFSPNRNSTSGSSVSSRPSTPSRSSVPSHGGGSRVGHGGSNGHSSSGGHFGGRR